jgi:M6 family metalloprotease-like protein
VNRRALGVLGGTATAALLVTSMQSPALAAPSGAPPASDAAVAHENAHKKDDRPDADNTKRRNLKQKGLELVLRGEREVQRKGDSAAVQVAPDEWAEFGTRPSDNVFTILAEFSADEADKDARFPTAPAGPMHNAIPKPDRSVDNTTYWEADFSREHYMEMFFNTEGESFKTVYEELSSGEYTINGDVSDWVTVPNNEASYGETESHTDMTRFVDDGAEAWFAQQQAAGKSTEDIRADLAKFDEWDRFDYDNDGNFDESDGYIDHYQQIHAGEDESAGAPSWAIWAHRWAVNQDGLHKDGKGPEFNQNGGVEIGDTGIWIRDYTTEPENGGLGVFAHEYAHDLGLPDLYDTAGGENGTGFWTLMSSGSWMGHGQDTIGTTPNHMGAWEKLQLGWLDYDVAQTGVVSDHVLGASTRQHEGDKAQAVVVVLPPDEAGNGRYYIAENRQYVDLDQTLAEGPYNFGWTVTKPDWVEHFKYQDGLSINYWNTAETNNRTAVHPGSGLVLPVDAHPEALRFSDNAVARNRIQTYDATFGLEATDAFTFHREVQKNKNRLLMTTLDAPSLPAVQVFNDSDPDRYYDKANPMGSVQVAGTGTSITVVGYTADGAMKVQVK